MLDGLLYVETPKNAFFWFCKPSAELETLKGRLGKVRTVVAVLSGEPFAEPVAIGIPPIWLLDPDAKHAKKLFALTGTSPIAVAVTPEPIESPSGPRWPVLLLDAETAESKTLTPVLSLSGCLAV